MRTVHVRRDGPFLLRWTAETIDSRGMRAVGLGMTKGAAIRDLHSRLRARDRFWKEAEQPKMQSESVEVDW